MPPVSPTEVGTESVPLHPHSLAAVDDDILWTDAALQHPHFGMVAAATE